MKKPWLTLISAVFLMLSFSLASCQPGEETPTPSAPTTQIPQTTTSNPTTTPAAPTTTTTTEPSAPLVTTSSETPPTTTKTATPTSTTPTTTPPTTTQLPTTTTTEPPITSATPPTTTSTKWQLNGYLLEGYPENIWPVYGSVAISHCVYQIDYVMLTSFPEHTYRVSYITDKSYDDLFNYYSGLLKIAEPDEIFEINGTISGYKVQAKFKDIGDGYHEVLLGVELPIGVGTIPHPLLADFPEFLIDCYAIGDVILEYYLCDSEGPNGSTVGYKMYQSQRAPNELVDHYVQLFESAADYEQYYEDEIGARVLEGTFGEIEARVELGLYWVEEWISISYRTYN